MKTLIFGGGGFIGTNLVEMLQRNKPAEQITVFDNFSMGNKLSNLELQPGIISADMRDYNAVKEAIAQFEPDIVYHLVANSDISASAERPALDVENTLLTTLNLALAIRETRPLESLVFASSSAVYGESDGPAKEAGPTKPISSYGWMKLASESALRQLVQENLVEKCLVSRFPNVTGKYQTHGVIFDLVKRLKENNEKLEVLGNGSQTKPYALAEELVENIYLAISNSQWKGFEIFNFSPPGQTSVREIALQIATISDYEPELIFGESPVGWPGDVNSYVLDCSKFEQQFGKLKFRNSDEAIAASISWAWSNLD